MSWTERNKPYNEIPDLPPDGVNLESVPILKAINKANKYLAELKGYCETLPHPELLLNTVMLQESRDSSAIENIVTTQDELYKGILQPFEQMQSNVKEVVSYRQAMYTGMDELKRTNAFTVGLCIKIMQAIKLTSAGIRQVPGTKLENPATKEIIYFPPDPLVAKEKLYALEKFLNQKKQELDPLLQMALMHYQFEAIHPFTDGNGRTGRILNVLFLVFHDLLNIPVLYHSSYIIQHKSDYYRLLRLVTEKGEWEPWILFMLKAVEETAFSTLVLVKNICELKLATLEKLKALTQKVPAHEINDLLFSYPYLKIKTLIERNIGARNAVSRYLQMMEQEKIVSSMKIGREIYYVNDKLMDVISKRINVH
jgi:Fic family protein